MSPDFVLAGRAKTLESIHKWLDDPTKPLALRGESRAEAAAVFEAALQKLDPDKRANLLSRTAVVQDATAWNRLAITDQPLILVQDFDSGQAAGRALGNGHGVVVLLGRRDAASSGTTSIPHVSRDEAENALVEMGVARKDVGGFAALAHRSLLALRRRMSVVPQVVQPAWARPDCARSVIAALLAGRWSHENQADQGIIARLGATAYPDLHDRFIRWANEDDPPIRSVGDAWYLTSEEDAWPLLARYLTRDDLRRLEEVVVDVLSPADPAFHLEQGRRYMARVLGHEPTHSGLLRKGLIPS